MSRKPRKPRNVSPKIWNDVDSPPLPNAFLKRLRPAPEAAPELVEAYRRSRGRPPKEEIKVPVTIRLDRQVVDAFRKSGPGWQTRINDILARSIPPGFGATKEKGRPKNLWEALRTAPQPFPEIPPRKRERPRKVEF